MEFLVLFSSGVEFDGFMMDQFEEKGAEEDNWSEGGRSNTRLEKTA